MGVCLIPPNTLDAAGQRRTPANKKAALAGLKRLFLDVSGLARTTQFESLAERGGFEPPIGYEPIHAFQACDFNHSSTSPASFLPFGKRQIIARIPWSTKLICPRLRTPL